MALSLGEDETGLAVHLEHLLYGVDVGSRSQVQTQLVLVGRPHDLLQPEGGGARGEGKSLFHSPVVCESE